MPPPPHQTSERTNKRGQQHTKIAHRLLERRQANRRIHLPHHPRRRPQPALNLPHTMRLVHLQPHTFQLRFPRHQLPTLPSYPYKLARQHLHIPLCLSYVLFLCLPPRRLSAFRGGDDIALRSVFRTAQIVDVPVDLEAFAAQHGIAFSSLR